MPKFIAITIGDIKGIGIEILLKTWRERKIKNIILFTNINVFTQYLKNKKIKIEVNLIDDKKLNLNYSKSKLNIYSFNSKNLADNTYHSLKFAYKFCKKNICMGMITLPLRKDIIKKKVNKKFIGQTEFFQNIDQKKFSNMILFHKKIIITTLTTHLEVKKISKILSNKNFLINQIINLNNTLKVDFNISNPKIIISGFNPHAGERGEIGNEEIKSIIPVVKKLKLLKIKIDGPFSADSILINENLNKYDCFIFIFHDQALIPFKFISQFTGVNYTGNLDIIRTSPDHGTGYNIIGTDKISTKSFINCYKLVKKIYKNRMINAKT